MSPPMDWTRSDAHAAWGYLLCQSESGPRPRTSRAAPVLVLSIDAINCLPLVVTVVVGTKGDNITRDYPTNVRLSPVDSGLPMETVFLGFQVRSLDPQRFLSPPAGRVTGAALRRIEEAVRYCLGL